MIDSVFAVAGSSVVVPVVSVVASACVGIAGVGAAVWQNERRIRADKAVDELRRTNATDLASLTHFYERERQRDARNAEWRKADYTSIIATVNRVTEKAARLSVLDEPGDLRGDVLSADEHVLRAAFDVSASPAMRSLFEEWFSAGVEYYQATADRRDDQQAAERFRATPDAQLRKEHLEAGASFFQLAQQLREQAGREVQGLDDSDR